MFTTLLESRAPRTRRLGGTVASVAAHAALIAAALTAVTGRGSAGAHDAPPARPPITFVPAPNPRPATGAPRTPGRAPGAPLPIHRFIDVPLPGVPPVVIDAPALPEQVTLGGSGISAPPISGTIPGGVGVGAPDGVVAEYQTDRAPRMLAGAAGPRYPDALRATGITGRVVAQFVVDTLGRAETEGVEIVDATRPEFAEAVLAALARFHFTPGEAGGRKVRTRVQLPFEFRVR